MSFRNLRPASFRGVPFDVLDAAHEFGPRVIRHEFAQQDDPTHEFNGSRPRSYQVEAILIGDRVDELAATFDAALAEKTPGRLVHPIYGEFDAVVSEPVRVRYSTGEHRVLRYAIVFERAGKTEQPSQRQDTLGDLKKAGVLTLAAAKADFAAGFRAIGQPAAVISAAREKISEVAAMVEAHFRPVVSPGLFGAVQEMAARLAAPSDAQLADVPGLAGALVGLVAHRAAPAYALLRLSGDVLAVSNITATTPSRRAMATNEASVVQLLEVAAAVTAVSNAAAQGWSSKTDAARWRDDASDALSRLADASADQGGQTWAGLTSLRVAVLNDTAARAVSLPALKTFTPAQTSSSVLLAYAQDGDNLTDLFDRASEIATRNGLRHPGFATGGREIEVLGDD